MQILPLLEVTGIRLCVLTFWAALGPIVHHFTHFSCIAIVADQTTCLQLVVRNVAWQASEMKNCVERGLPLPSIWLIHLTDCY